jgi:AraC-like DNA-binding protein
VTFDGAPFRLRTLHQTAAVSLVRFDHPPGSRLDDTEEQAPELFQINIVEHGWFRLQYGRSDYTLGPGSVFLARPGEVYRYGHFRDVDPDVCSSINFRGHLAGQVAAMFPRLALVPPPTNRLRYLQLQLQRSTNDDQLAVESIASEFVDAVEHARDGCHLYRPQQLKWYVQRIQAAREEMDANVAGRHSLWQLSSTVAMSPFVFARVFRELVGVPPHRYLLRRRLEWARTLLESGMSVTDTCYEVGFNNLAHFTRTYRRHFGTLPSAARGRSRVTFSARIETS